MIKFDIMKRYGLKRLSIELEKGLEPDNLAIKKRGYGDGSKELATKI
jgi:hypothetical protein